MRLKLSRVRFKTGAVVGTFIVILDIFLQIWTRGMNYGIENSGVSFGQLSGIRVNWILFVLTILTSYALKCKLHNLGLLYVIIGGLGNFFTRVLFGSVWDYITVYGLPFWFNISDVLITIGIVSYILVDYGY